jgi:hypothetical protein
MPRRIRLLPRPPRRPVRVPDDDWGEGTMNCLRDSAEPTAPKSGAFRISTPSENVEPAAEDTGADEAEIERMVRLLEGLDEQAINALFEEYLRRIGSRGQG